MEIEGWMVNEWMNEWMNEWTVCELRVLKLKFFWDFIGLSWLIVLVDTCKSEHTTIEQSTIE